jgi:hypothetical protein
MSQQLSFAPSYNIPVEDMHYVFLGLECVALIAIILILAVSLIKRPGPIKEKYRKVTWVFVALLIIGIAGAYATDLAMSK